MMQYTSTYINDLIYAQSACPNLHKIYGMRILVTGATGLVCSAIVDFLLALNDSKKAEIKIYVAARSIKKAEMRFGQRMHRADVSFVEYDALMSLSWDFDVDYIIHGASPANPVLYVKQPVETMLTNFLGMSNILKYAKDHNTKRVIFISSSEVYGIKSNLEPYGDSEYGYIDILDPRACYPSAKRACETLCVSFYAEYDVDSVIVRLGHIYGPTATRTDTRASSQFFYDVLDGRDIVMKSAGSQLRSYCYVVDCTSAIITVLINGDVLEAYNVGNPNSVISIRDLAELISNVSQKKLVFELPTDEEKAGYNLMDNSSLCTEKLLSCGWNPLFSAQVGVQHTFDIMKGL